jgi:hypothetical protein
MATERARLTIGVANVVLLLACSGPQMASVPLTSGRLEVPEYVLPPSRQPPTQPIPSGTYAGVVEPLSTAGGDINCMSTVQIAGWYVYGNRVWFGQFRGTIDSDDGLQMVYGRDWITGQFHGATFHGWLIDDGTPNFVPGCSFMIRMQRVGP